MRIKSLQMQGFKSFGDKTELRFDDQIIGIVGPNGCGKSNIVDAIRWVMGEQSAKGLRGSEMSDVIFNGTTERKKGSFAEVSLVFDNADKSAPAPYQDCSEVMITRRLYRSGESEYLINKVAVRLKDINDLFLGTGSSARAYSIVAQGKVDQVVLAKPEDRRFLLEEAAGIAKYKIRRQAAERKIEATKTNLERVQDIIGELEKNSRYLDRQVERAEKFRKLQTELRGLDEQIVSAKVTKLDREASSNQEKLDRNSQEFSALETQLREVEAAIEEARFQALNFEKNSSSDYEKLLALKENFSASDKRIELATQRIQLLENQIREREKDIERIRAKSEANAQSASAVLADRESLESQKIEKTEELRFLKAEVDRLQKELDLAYSSINELQARAEQSRSEAARRSQKIDDFQKERDRLDQERSKLLDHVAGVKLENERLSVQEVDTQSRLGELGQEEERLSQRQNQLKQDLEVAKHDEEVSRNELRQWQQVVVQSDADIKSLQTLEEHEVGYAPGVLNRKKITGYPIIMDLVRVAPEHDKIGAAFLSEFGQRFIDSVSSSEGILTGRISVLRVSNSTDLASGTTFWDLLEGDRPALLENFLRSIEIVETAASFTGERIQIDREGNLSIPLPLQNSLHIQGQISAKETPFGRREELAQLEQRRDEAQKNIERVKFAIDQIKIKLGALAQDLKSVESDSKRTNEQLSLAKVSLAKFETQRESAQARLLDLDRRLETTSARIQKVSDELQTLMVPLEIQQPDEEIQRLRSLTESLRAEKESADAKWLEKRIELGALEEKLARIIEQTIHAEMTQSEYSHNQSIFQQDIDAWKSEIENERVSVIENQKSRDASAEEAKTLEIQVAETRGKLNTLRSNLDQLEVERRQRSSHRDQSQKAVQDQELERQRLKFEIEELSQIVHERYHVSLQDILANVSPDVLERLEDETVLRAMEVDAKELREQVEKFGDVNLLALSEYEEMTKRLTFMNTQKEDLLRTLDALQSIIDRINKITEFRFRETFKAINHNFQVLFPKLFGGGRAFMSLTNENDLLETGVEIFAEPPGKKVQSMSLLSGGEKALTSISLLFALFAYRPASFCILDEVDAPLDEVNTSRYNNIIKEMASLSQFIVITHNKKTMEVAETLFGVTMQEPGVTQIVGVELQEARAFVASA